MTLFAACSSYRYGFYSDLTRSRANVQSGNSVSKSEILINSLRCHLNALPFAVAVGFLRFKARFIFAHLLKRSRSSSAVSSLLFGDTSVFVDAGVSGLR